MRLIFSSIILLGSIFLSAQDLSRLGPEEAVKWALERNLSLQAFSSEADIIQAQAAEVLIDRQPQISARADVQFNPILPASVIPIGEFIPGIPSEATSTVRFGTLWQNAAGIQVDQTLWNPGIKAQSEAIAYQALFTVNQQEQSAISLVESVLQTYYAVLVADAETEFARQDLDHARRFREELEIIVRGGKALPTDLNRAIMAENQALLRLQTSEQNRVLARKTLLNRLSINLDQEPQLALPVALEDLLQESGIPGAPGYRKEMERLDLETGLQDLQIDLERTRRAPTLSATAYLGANNFGEEAPFFEDNSWFATGFIGLNLRVPLSEYWQTGKRLEEFRLRQEQIGLQKTELQAQMALEVETAKNTLLVAELNLDTRKKDLALATENLQLTEASFREGRVLASAVSESRLELQRMQYQYLQSAYDYLLAVVRLKKALGILA